MPDPKEALPATQPQTSRTLEKVIIDGDLSALSASERISYYMQVCEATGLNPASRPFEYLKLSGKLTLYARKDATEQLRKLHGVSITALDAKKIEDVYVVTAHARDRQGREDCATGAVTIGSQKGDNLANALMKAETKAKRRVTLSICGLGLLDETEVSTIPGSAPIMVDSRTGEILSQPEPSPTTPTTSSQRKESSSRQARASGTMPGSSPTRATPAPAASSSAEEERLKIAYSRIEITADQIADATAPSKGETPEQRAERISGILKEVTMKALNGASIPHGLAEYEKVADALDKRADEFVKGPAADLPF